MQKFSNLDFFFWDFYHCKMMSYRSYVKKCKKNGGSPTSFWREHAWKNTLNLKKLVSE